MQIESSFIGEEEEGEEEVEEEEEQEEEEVEEKVEDDVASSVRPYQLQTRRSRRRRLSCLT